jgi:hypothetical protein
MADVKFFKQMKSIRAEDKYPNKDLEKHIIDKIFPKDAEELALKLSNVTAGFYGFALKNIGQQCDWDKVDSKNLAKLLRADFLPFDIIRSWPL